MPFGIALIHAKQISGKQRSFVTTCARSNFKDDVFFVRCILGQQQNFEALFNVRQPVSGVAHLFFGKSTHLGIAVRIGDHAAQIGDFRLGRTQIFYAVDHRHDFRVFFRQPNIIRRLYPV